MTNNVISEVKVYHKIKAKHKKAVIKKLR